MTKTILTMAMLSASAFAQYNNGPYNSPDPYRNRGYDDDRYDRRGGYGRPYGPHNPYAQNQRLIDSIQFDLQRIGQRAAWDNWARRQFGEAIGNLEQFQRRFASGHFDNGRLDRAIDNLNRLLTAPELYPADRQRIAYARDQLRGFRANRGLRY